MNNIKKLLAMLVCAAMTLATAPCLTVAAADGVPEGLHYYADAGHMIITGYSGNETELDIPADISGLLVTAIADGSFWGSSNLTRIKLPDSVTLIGSYAFSGCSNLAKINIPANVKEIKDNAFSYCPNITNVTIPDGAESIGDCAFEGCSKLTGMVIPASVLSIGTDAFFGCPSLTEINVDTENKNYKSQDGVLFDKGMTNLIQYPIGNARTSYNIPDGVTYIGSKAFYNGTWLEKIGIPADVAEIGVRAFSGCSSLVEINVAAGNESYKSQDGVLFDKEMTKLVQYPAGIANASYNFPEGVTKIGDYAFYFSRLPKIDIPAGVTEVGLGAFSDGILLTSVYIPDSVTYIGGGAFGGGSNLVEINVAAGNEYYKSQDGVLFNKKMTELIQYPLGIAEASYDIPEGVTTIGEEAFSNSKLTEIDITDGVTEIGGRAFMGCSNLTSATIPVSMARIGTYAFGRCARLANIYYDGNKAAWDEITVALDAIPVGVKIHCKSGEPELPDPEVNINGGELTVTVEGPDVPAAAIIAIGCGADGELIDAAAVTNGKAKLTGEGVKTVKVFCWESLQSMRPLCPAKEVEVGQ